MPCLGCCASCFFENSLHEFLEETRCSSRPMHRSFRLPHVSRFFVTTRQTLRALFVFLIDATLEMMILMHF